MLKTKIFSATIIISSFLLMSVTTASKAVHSKPGSDTLILHQTGIHQFDSGGLCTCIPFLITDNTKAPQAALNKNVAGFVNAYIKKNGYFLGKTRGSNAAYFSIMDAVFAQHDMPVELKYLSFIESGMKRNAGAWTGAVGPWSLMPVAAKQYGLKISGYKDERLDYAKSTKAAAALLTDLYNEYGDWLLVIAAYNCGPGGIQKAIKKSGSTNYWTLQSFLPEETRKHVKKFIAVHYYFEGHGSVATMTKAEMEKHEAAVKVFAAQQETVKIDSAASVANTMIRSEQAKD